MATNSFGHRYFIVSFIVLNLLVFKIVEVNFKSKKVIYALLFLGLITGNLWIYPKNISQGWDATLGHTPYHSLRLEAINYLDNNNITINEVATFFPNYQTINTIDLSGDFRTFKRFHESHEYVLYSNVFNLSDEDLNILNKNYISIKEFNNFNIYIIIYRLKEK
ncbi:MAG: hypothetical protein HWD82_05440 [Flavobacteriaceae bacterium]|nr:hypothetical protein [Flavobacteriaceae bacterium]